jgi:hypothetical protein
MAASKATAASARQPVTANTSATVSHAPSEKSTVMAQQQQQQQQMPRTACGTADVAGMEPQAANSTHDGISEPCSQADIDQCKQWVED